MKKLTIVALLSILSMGCKDSQRAQFSALGKHHFITLYANDGKVIQQWESTGNVSNEKGSDGWYFEDSKTGLLVEVTGTLVITVKP